MKNKILILAIIGVSLIAFTVKAYSVNEENLSASVFHVYQGGTGASTFTSGECLVGNDAGAITTQACGAGGSMTALPHTQLYVGNGSNNATATSSITVLDNGNVGIGTTSPENTLEIDGDVFIGNSGVRQGLLEVNLTDDYSYSQAIKMVADRSGLAVQYGFNGTATGANTKNVGLYGWASEATNNYGLWVDSGYSYMKDRLGLIDSSPEFMVEIASTTENGYFGATKSADGDIFIIDENGNVGIGTTSPMYALDVNGTGHFTGALTLDTALTDANVSNDLTITNLSGTNTGDITLAGTPDYLTIANQVLTRSQIDLTTDVTGILPDANVADDITASNYLSLTTWYATTTHSLINSLPALTTVGTIGTGVWNGTAIDFSDYTNATAGTGITFTDDAISTNDGAIDHDGLLNFVANEHLDWTSDLGAVNINAGNYTTLTDLTDFDQTAWRLFYSNNLGDVIELSLGTDGQYLQSQGGTASLTWSVPTNTTYTGGTNLTLDGTTFNVDDSFIKNDGDVGTGVFDFGGATSFEIPNGASPTVDAYGEIAVDTEQLIIGDSGNNARVLPLEISLFGTTIASTSEEFVSGGALSVAKIIDKGRSIKQFRCWVEGGTSVVMNVSDGTNDTETITCATTVTSDTDVATNNTFTANEKWELQFGTITGAVDYVIFEAIGFITRE